MSWLKIDDKFARHPKVMQLSHIAFRLHVAALCNCADMLTDGRVTERDVRMLCPVIGAPTWKRYVNELISTGLWTVQAHGWSINDYLDYNPSSIKVKEQRERHAAQQRDYRRAQARDRARVPPTARAPSPTRIEKELPTTLVPRDATSEVDAENVIELNNVLRSI